MTRASRLQFVKIGPDGGSTKFVPVKNFSTDPAEVIRVEDEAYYGVADTRPGFVTGRTMSPSFSVNINGMGAAADTVTWSTATHPRVHDLLLASGFTAKNDNVGKKLIYHMTASPAAVKNATIEWWLHGGYQKMTGLAFNMVFNAKANDVLSMDFNGKGQYTEDPYEVAQPDFDKATDLLGGNVLRSSGEIKLVLGASGTPHGGKTYKLSTTEFSIDTGNQNIFLGENINQKYMHDAAEIMAPRTVMMNMTVKENLVGATPGTLSAADTATGADFAHAKGMPNFWTVLQQFVTGATDYRPHTEGEKIAFSAQFGKEKNNWMLVEGNFILASKPTRTVISEAVYYQLQCQLVVDKVTNDGTDDLLRYSFGEAFVPFT